MAASLFAAVATDYGRGSLCQSSCFSAACPHDPHPLHARLPCWSWSPLRGNSAASTGPRPGGRLKPRNGGANTARGGEEGRGVVDRGGVGRGAVDGGWVAGVDDGHGVEAGDGEDQQSCALTLGLLTRDCFIRVSDARGVGGMPTHTECGGKTRHMVSRRRVGRESSRVRWGAPTLQRRTGGSRAGSAHALAD